jgi:hypothetical protein
MAVQYLKNVNMFRASYSHRCEWNDSVFVNGHLVMVRVSDTILHKGRTLSASTPAQAACIDINGIILHSYDHGWHTT